MYKYKISRKGVFRTEAPNIKIYDNRGILFYDSTENENFSGEFTLPLIDLGNSTYYSTAKFSRIADNFKYHDYVPKYERDQKNNFKKFKIVFLNNPNKCTIKHNRKKIIFDTSFKRKPYPILMFILLHEVGHNWYHTEEKCDEFAVNTMLRKGYTPFQIFYACNKALSDKAIDRKRNVFNQINNRL